MKYIEKYRDLGINNETEAFEFLMSTLKDTIRTHDFYVAWEKVLNNVYQIEVGLNILNTLIGKDDIKNRLKDIIRKYPEVVPIIPILIAFRGNIIKVISKEGDIEYSFLKKKIYSEDEIEKIAHFTEESGLLRVMSDKNIKNLVDYTVGIEVGLDTNARKNRSGFAMEKLTEVYIKSICEKCNFRYLRQATVNEIKSVFGKDVITDKANRHFDFAIDTGAKLYLIEVNYYGGGGSKLKSVAGEFSTLFTLVNNDDTGFIWITDGKGWLTAKRHLLETYNLIDYVMNIKMLNEGILEEVLLKGL